MTDLSRALQNSGITFVYDENSYFLVNECGLLEYRAGDILSEFFRMDTELIKDMIMQCKHLHKKFTDKNAFIMMDEIRRLSPYYYVSPLIHDILILFFSNVMTIWMEAVTSGTQEDFVKQVNSCCTNEFRKKVFEGTGYISAGGETMLQLMLSTYLCFIHTFEFLKKIFVEFCEMQSKGKNIDDNLDISSYFDELIETQNIEYQIDWVDGELKPIYSCKSLISLFLFDISNCIKDHTVFVKCQNCGNYFVPLGRSDTKYCHYPLNDRTLITCHDVGAQNARSYKEKTDAVTRAYRNAYMNLKMAARRHPDEPSYEDKLNKLQTLNKAQMNRIHSNEISEEEYINWLNDFMKRT